MTGIVYALTSAALFGISAPIAKLLLSAISPWLLAGILYLGSGLGLAIARRFRRSNETQLQKADRYGHCKFTAGVPEQSFTRSKTQTGKPTPITSAIKIPRAASAATMGNT